MGCDHRVFKRLQVSGYELVALPWVPYDNNDTLETYAKKMAVNLTEKEPILLGLSFGGMLAVEIGKLAPVRQIILISSAKTRYELPEPGKLARYLVKNQLIPAFAFSLPNRFLMALRRIVPLGERTAANGATAINGKFMRWALKAVMEWQNTATPQSVKHIHGTLDFVIPGSKVAADYTVKYGIHLMVFSRAREVSKIISSILAGNKE